MKKILGAVMGLVLCFCITQKAQAVVVDSGSISNIDLSDIVAFPSPTPTGSGLGNLDLNMIQHGGGGAGNADGAAHNYDDANTDMSDPSTNESYITSFGDLRGFYNYNFPSTPINEIVLFLNINEEGTPQDIHLDQLNIIKNYTTPTTGGRDNPFANDISSGYQNSTGNVYDGGIRIAKLGSGAPFILNQIHTGIGRPDYYILTGINPFDSTYLDSDRILFNWRSSAQSDGGEAVYLSGKLRREDLISSPIPEPASLSLLGLGLLGLVGLRKRKIA